MQAHRNIENNSTEQPFVLIENETQQNRATGGNAQNSRDFQIETSVKPIQMTLIANRPTAALAHLVPIAHQISETINRLEIENSAANGNQISCRKGCANCCSYMVSLSSAEAFYLHNHILSLPSGKRKTIVHKFMRAARKIAANKIPTITPKMNQNQGLKAISNWYRHLNLTCPFIEENACSQYANRPLVCREHLVTNPPKACNPLSAMSANSLDLPFSLAEILMEVSNAIESTDDEAVILPLAMVWTGTNSKRAKTQYPTTDLTDMFINAITAKTPAKA